RIQLLNSEGLFVRWPPREAPARPGRCPHRRVIPEEQSDRGHAGADPSDDERPRLAAAVVVVGLDARHVEDACLAGRRDRPLVAGARLDTRVPTAIRRAAEPAVEGDVSPGEQHMKAAHAPCVDQDRLVRYHDGPTAASTRPPWLRRSHSTGGKGRRDDVAWQAHRDRLPRPVEVADGQLRPADLGRVRDLLVLPEATLLIDRWSEDWSKLAWLRLECRGELLEPEPHEREEHAAAIAGLRRKYEQYASQRLEERPVLRLTVNRALGWGDL